MAQPTRPSATRCRSIPARCLRRAGRWSVAISFASQYSASRIARALHGATAYRRSRACATC